MRAKNPTYRSLSTKSLFKMNGAIMDELRRREIVRTSNNPGGDYAEALFAKAYKWKLASNSAAGYDATYRGKKYQIKCRRLTKHNRSRHLGAIRNFERKNFDCLAAVIFNEDYSVHRAIIVPRDSLKRMKSRYSKHVNGRIFRLYDEAWTIKGASDATDRLRKAAKEL